MKDREPRQNKLASMLVAGTLVMGSLPVLIKEGASSHPAAQAPTPATNEYPPSDWGTLPPAPPGYHWAFLECWVGDQPNHPDNMGCWARQLKPDNERDSRLKLRNK